MIIGTTVIAFIISIIIVLNILVNKRSYDNGIEINQVTHHLQRQRRKPPESQ